MRSIGPSAAAAARRRKRGMRWSPLLAAMALPRLVSGCDLCEGGAGPSGGSVTADGVLELTPSAFGDVVDAHPLVVLLLYRPWCSRTRKLHEEYAAAARTLRPVGTSVALARIDASEYPEFAATLGVSPAALPALRVHRGDAQFGAMYRGGLSAAKIASYVREELSRRDGAALQRVGADWRESPAPASTRVIGRLSKPRSLRAYEQVAMALGDVIEFALEEGPGADDPPVPPAASPAAPSAPPAMPPSSAPEEVTLQRERSPAMAGEAAAVTMAAPTDGLDALALERWVRWAALPSVHALTPQSARAYLAEGAAGILIAPDGMHADVAASGLRHVADALSAAGRHGLWLLHAARSDEAHARLIDFLGVRGPFAAFVVVESSGYRISAKYTMHAPFTWASLEDHAAAYLRGELTPDTTPILEEALRAVTKQPLLSAAGAALAIVSAWAVRRCAHAAPPQHAKQA